MSVLAGDAHQPGLFMRIRYRKNRPRTDAILARRFPRGQRRPPGRSRARTSARHPSPARATVRTSRRDCRRSAGRKLHRDHPFLAKRECDRRAKQFVADFQSHDQTWPRVGTSVHRLLHPRCHRHPCRPRRPVPPPVTSSRTCSSRRANAIALKPFFADKAPAFVTLRPRAWMP